ncbi:MAG: pilus assembly protein PilM [Euzebyales bacterium]|nr:pilus assembly protein PilM [Euzebyales bacterium]
MEEIRGSLDYYRAQDGSVPVRRVILSGGGSQLPNLRERLADTLRLPVDRGHPMQDLKVGKVGVAPEQLVAAEPYLAVAVGLALGGLS